MIKNISGKNKLLMNREFTLKGFSLIFIGLFLVISLFSLASAVTIKSAVTSPSEIAPGEIAKITIEIENILSDDVQNVNVALDLSGTVPIAPYQGSSEKSVDEIREGDDEKFTFNIIVLPEASPGIYKIPVKVSYMVNGTLGTKNGTIGVMVNSPARIKISVEGYLIKGQEGTVDFRIVNDGLSDLKLVSVQTIQPVSGATINSPLYEYLGNIDSDDFETVELTIFARENSGSSILIPLKIIYKDTTNKDFTQEETLNVKVYSQEEAENLGLIEKQNYTLYIAIGIIVLLYIFYRIRKRMKRKKALGA